MGPEVPAVAALLSALTWCVSIFAERPPLLSVGLIDHCSRVKIGGTKGLTIYDVIDGQKVYTRWSGKPFLFTSNLHGFEIADVGTYSRVRVVPLKGSRLTVDGKRYRGELIVTDDKLGKITVINLVDLESYLYGVIKGEMLITSPLEALKAQAVISRTFALTHKDQYLARRGYGLSCSTSSQVYQGMEGEDPRAIRAVDETRGEVLTYAGHLINCYYHSACGGWTISNKDAWGGKQLPYLKSRRCGFCSYYHRNFEWHAEVSCEDILRRLLEKGYTIGTIVKVTPTYSDYGRILRIAFEDKDGNEVELLGNQFRLLMGTDVIRSSFFMLESPPSPNRDAREERVSESEKELRKLLGEYLAENTPPRKLYIVGYGLGHGVGLCQSGARRQAELGWKYHEILKYYYSGVELEKKY